MKSHHQHFLGHASRTIAFDLETPPKLKHRMKYPYLPLLSLVVGYWWPKIVLDNPTQLIPFIQLHGSRRASLLCSIEKRMRERVFCDE